MGRTLEEKTLSFERHYTTEGIHPFNEHDYSTRSITITDKDKGVVFHEPEAVFPTSWSDNAAQITASKYFKQVVPVDGKERDVRRLISRVTGAIRAAGIRQGIIQEDNADVFEEELCSILINQRAAFNSPVWFNLGLHEQYGITCLAKPEEPFYGFNPVTGTIEQVHDTYARPQISACFINKVEDSIASVCDEAKQEGLLFKYGSGTGTNFSPLRGKGERLSGGGGSSGAVGFMHPGDCIAGIIKSGGKTRRAAKMIILDVDHPDIEEFIDWKPEEEKKVAALGAFDYDTGFEGNAYDSVTGQNANMSVRVTDEFMNTVATGGTFNTINRIGRTVHKTHDAKTIYEKIATAAWSCGDPGIQFDTTINEWHTCPNTDRINASNPCSEYMFLDDSSCNLASLNLMKFKNADGSFDVRGYQYAIQVMITAMEILVDHASYPKKEIAQNSHDYRPLGLGYANLGALLMQEGLPYDSDEGRALCGALTAILTGEGYAQSARIAHQVGAFEGFEHNKEPFLNVIRKHKEAVNTSMPSTTTQVAGLEELVREARVSWKTAEELGIQHGYRNAQISVLAPTGTIGFMMDCDTTGIEPDLCLVKTKTLSGGGTLLIVNTGVEKALNNLGYTPTEIVDIQKYVEEQHHVEGAPHLKQEHLPIFDCAFTAGDGTRSIHYMGHVKMLSAAQPFISGAISKTVNMPHDATIDDVAEAYTEAWNLGLKSLAIFRDGSKMAQALHTKKYSQTRPRWGEHRPLPEHSFGNTAKTTFKINGVKGELTIQEYSNGRPGGLEIKMFQPGSTFQVLLGDWADTASLWLQYGVPLEEFVNDTLGHSYAPSGFVEHPHIKSCTSIPDLVAKYIALHYLGRREFAQGVDSSALEQVLRHNNPDQNVMNEEWGERRKLPKRRLRLGEKVTIAGEGVHIAFGEYADGTPGEIFVDMAKAGEDTRGIFNSWAIAQSKVLQRGMPFEDFVAFNKNRKMEPSGETDHSFIKYCSSIQDLVARIGEVEYLGNVTTADVPVHVAELRIEEIRRHNNFEATYRVVRPEKFNGTTGKKKSSERIPSQGTNGTGGKPCSCGGIMKKVGGNCYKCTGTKDSPGCGSEDGGCGGG